MSAESIEEKVSSLPMSQGKAARCRRAQLVPRLEHASAKWVQTWEAPLGHTAEVITRMGLRETWRVVEAGKDPLLEKVEP